MSSPEAAPPLPASGLSQREANDVLWQVAGSLYRRWKFIAGVTVLAIVISVVIALLTPKWYAAEARVLQPEGGGLSMLGLVNRATGGLGSLLGGSGGYERYLAILTSRTMAEEAVERFNLIDVYEIEEAESDREAQALAIERFGQNVGFDISLEYNYLGITAFDRDPERAAEMANFMVGHLNRRNAELSSETARQTRTVIEQRVNRATADLDSVRNELQAFQEAHGLVELEAQSQAMMQSLATLKAETAKLEIQYQALAQQYGPDNPQVLAARQARDAARASVRQTLGGGDALLPVSMGELPALTNRYARLMQDQMIQQQILETVYPIYEQALFQEQNEAEAVQVLDDAVAPLLAARPSRRLIVIGTTLTAFLLTCLYVVAQAWISQHAHTLAGRLRHAAVPMES